MKLRPKTTAHSHCVRCDMQLTDAVGQVRAICSPCDLALQTLHQMQEYVLYGRTYYRCSLEGTSYAWLMSSKYRDEIKESPVPTKRNLMVQAAVVTVDTPDPKLVKKYLGDGRGHIEAKELT